MILSWDPHESTVIRTLFNKDIFIMTSIRKNGLCNLYILMSYSKGARFSLTCNHLKCLDYYTESILAPNGFTAYPCASYTDFTAVSKFHLPAKQFCHLSYHDQCIYLFITSLITDICFSMSKALASFSAIELFGGEHSNLFSNRPTRKPKT